MKGRFRAGEIGATVLLGLVAGLAYERLRYGVNFTDEAYYAVLAQRFALGDQPYIDEVNLRQSAALLTAPFYALYLSIRGSTDGVVYFLRHLFFLLQCLVALAAFRLVRLAKPDGSKSAAFLAAALPLTYIPFSIPACGYNNLGAFFFALGSLIGLQRVLSDVSPRVMTFSGCAHGLGIIAYPPMILPVLVFHGAVAWQRGDGDARARVTSLKASFAGLFMVGIPFLLHAGSGLVTGIPRAFAYERMFTRPRDLHKVLDVAIGGWRQSWPVLIVIAASTLAGWRSTPGRKHALIAVMIVSTLWWFWFPRAGHFLFTMPHDLSSNVIIGLAFLSGALLLFQPAESRRTLFACALLPSLLAGALIAMASDAGWTNSALGLFSAATILPLLVACVGGTVRDRFPAFLALALIPLALTKMNYWATFSFDGSTFRQTRQVAVGPYLGLYTTPSKAAHTEELTSVMRTLARPGERILVAYDPGPYLCQAVRPGLETAWTDDRAHLDKLLPYYHSKRSGEGIVLLMGKHSVSRLLENLVEAPERLLWESGPVRIYREPPLTSVSERN